MPVQYDVEYAERMSQALLNAVFQTSMDEDRVALMKTGEIADAALNLIAMMSAGSDMTATPTKRRHFIDMIGKKLLGKIVSFQADVAKHGWPKGFVNLNDRDYQ